MEDRGYVFVDGSHLFASIHTLWRERPEYKNHKLHIGRFCEALVRRWSLNVGSFVRTTIYVKPGDPRLDRMTDVPQAETPGAKEHWRIIECGVSLDAIPEEELQKISSRYRDHFARAEKGLDIKLACDSLMLVTGGRASSLVFLLNDRDYMPLLEAIQSYGGNTYLTGLDSKQSMQRDLAKLADRFLTLDDELPFIFGLQPPEAPPVLQQGPVEGTEPKQ